jgi:hypothetical protein
MEPSVSKQRMMPHREIKASLHHPAKRYNSSVTLSLV